MENQRVIKQVSGCDIKSDHRKLQPKNKILAVKSAPLIEIECRVIVPSNCVNNIFDTASAHMKVVLSKYKLVSNVHSTKEQEIDYRADYITGGVCCCRRWILLQPGNHATHHATDQKY